MEIVKKTFDLLEQSKTTNEVEEILDKLNIDLKYRINPEIYPEIKFKITKQEIEELKSKGLISKDNVLVDLSHADTLTKLLYSVLWKNGDLKKINHIIEGIISDEPKERENGLVFYQFGKYLTKKPGEPIIDQHVLRAFGIYKANGDEKEIERFKRLSLITKNERDLIDAYKKWLQTGLKEELRNCKDYSYHVDKVLFAVGKSIKEKK